MIYLLNKEPDFNYDKDKPKYYLKIGLDSIDKEYITLNLEYGDFIILEYKTMKLIRHIELGSEWFKKYINNILVNVYGRDVELTFIKEKDGSDAFDNILGYMQASGIIGSKNPTLVNLIDKWEQDKKC